MVQGRFGCGYDNEEVENPLIVLTIEPEINGKRASKIKIETEDIVYDDDFGFNTGCNILEEMVRKELKLSKTDKIEIWDYDYDVIDWRGWNKPDEYDPRQDPDYYL